MSALSGIGISQALLDVFNEATTETDQVRFISVSIHNEQLVPDVTEPVEGTLEEDLAKLQHILHDDVPAYILARLDNDKGWLAISYVPDVAKVRDKMIYASSRNILSKSLGSGHFVDNIFATSKDDLTDAAYAAHKAHNSAPKPLTPREKELEDLKAAERLAGGADYVGSRARKSHVGGIGFTWSDGVEAAVRELGESSEERLVVMSVDPGTESLLLLLSEAKSVNEIATSLPESEPCYALYSWNHGIQPQGRSIVFIYSCPSSSPVKHRMLYSSGSLSVSQGAKAILPESAPISRKIESSDPKEIDEAFLKSELGLVDTGAVTSPLEESKPAFARPRGPGRKR